MDLDQLTLFDERPITMMFYVDDRGPALHLRVTAGRPEAWQQEEYEALTSEELLDVITALVLLRWPA